MEIVLACDPLVQDVVIAGPNRDDIGALIFPRLDDARKLAGLPAEASAAQVLAHSQVRGVYQAPVDPLWAEGTGRANREARAVVLEEPPHIDRGEVTDRGSIDQRAVLAHRAELVAHLFADVPGPE